MGERRKRKSAWDEDDTKHLSGMSEHRSWTGNDRRSSHGSGHYHEVYESRARKPRDDSGYPAWDPIEEHPIAPMNSSGIFKNTQDDNEFDGGKRYYKNMSPGYDGMELHNYNDTHGYDQIRSQRYSGRGRSQSRSRSRSRSLSRGRERQRRRGWTRSRSRNRYDARAKDQSRSRSPINERLSYGWSERRSVPEKSSQICRDLSEGSCRRGSQCRFLHPNITSHRERDQLEDEPIEIWRGRTDHNHVPRHSYSRASSGFESRNDFSETYHEDRKTLPCKDFLKGNCRWGDACRYSHHDDDFGQGTGNVSSDKGKSGRPMCKFFTAGKCNRENCRFSHDDGYNDRRGEVTNRHARDKVNWLDEPTWDNPTKILDPSDRRGEVNNSRSHDKSNLWCPTWDNANKISHMNDRRGEFTDGHSRDKGNMLDVPTWDNATKISETNDNRVGEVTESLSRDNDTWLGSSCNDATKISDTNDKRSEFIESFSHEKGNRSDSSTWGDATKISGSGNEQIDQRLDNENRNWGMKKSTFFGENMGFAEPIAKENTAYEQERLISHGSEFQYHDGILNVDGKNTLQENLYPSSQIQQQHCRVVENNQMSSLGSDVLDEVKETTTNHPILFSGHQNAGSIFPVHSSISSKTDRGQNILLRNPPNIFCADLNEPNTEIADPLSVPTYTENEQKASQSPPGFLEANPQVLANLLAKKLSDQATNSSFVNKEHPQTHTQMPSFPDKAGWVPHVNTLTVQPNLGTDTLDLNSTGNGRGNAEYADLNIPRGTENKQPSPLYAVGPPGFDSINVSQGDVVANSEVARGNAVPADESKGVEANKLPETQNGHEKVEEGSGVNKDEKGTRLFKISLVEFVKEIVKPTWKEGRMSRDVHKTVVRKVVDKVSSTIHADHIPKTKEKIDQYLAASKPKITKLVQAYVERSLKKDS